MSAFEKSDTPGQIGDGGGLWLIKRKNGSIAWMLRYSINGKRKQMGLGPLRSVGLAQARSAAEKWRAIVQDGRDPMAERGKAKQALSSHRATVAEVAVLTFEARKAELKGDGKAGRWFSPVEAHILPKLGNQPIEDLSQTDIKAVLSPIWHEKSATATKAAQRLSLILKHATAMGLNVDLQCVEKAKALLGKQRHSVTHHRSMPWQNVPTFFTSMSADTPTELALKLLILTGVRASPLRFMRLDQIDGDVWTIPAEKMKGRRDATSDFRVPLSRQALATVDSASSFARNGYLFPGQRSGVISDATMGKYLKTRDIDAVPHGFRSSIRVWLAECTSAPYEVAETVMAHASGSKVVRSYQRSDFLDKRRILMQDWADFVSSTVPR